MTTRIIIGQHPDGSKGLFVSKPGVDAGATFADDRNGWIFSSNWSRVGSILASGTCVRGQRVYHYDPGYLPYVWFEQYSGNTFFDAAVTNYGKGNVVEVGTTFLCNHYTQNSFQIDRQFEFDAAVANVGDPNATFRYIVFAIPIQY